MTTTDPETHYLVDDLGPAEPAPDPPIRDQEGGHFVTDLGPEPDPPPPPEYVDLETLLAALRRLVIPTRDVSADDWAAWRVNLAGAETNVVANRQPSRTSLLIANLSAGGGAATAYLSSRANLSPAGINTYPVAAGTTFSLDSTGPVYACTDTGAAIQLAVLAGYDTAAGGEL